MVAASLELGREVKLHVQGAVFHGFVFAVDEDSDLVIIEEPHPQSTLKQDVRFVKLSLVDKVEELAGTSEASKSGVVLPEITQDMLRKREREGLAKAEKELDRIGKGVSPGAQILYNNLDKTYRLKWKGQDIITELGITIKPPYGPADCSGRDAAALDRMRKVVETINGRIASGELTE